MSDKLEVYATNLSQGIALMSDDTIAPITAMFDCEGDFTDDWHEATACVVRYSATSWFAVDCHNKSVHPTH